MNMVFPASGVAVPSHDRPFSGRTYPQLAWIVESYALSAVAAVSGWLLL
jgi:hypothetical protein